MRSVEKSRPTDTPSKKAHDTAKWARTMTCWLIRRSTKGGVRWQVVNFNGPSGSESCGIVDLIAIRKDHRKSEVNGYRGDLFEIVLIQVKGGTARFPTMDDLARLEKVKKHHRAAHVVLAEWKIGEKLCFYLLPNISTGVPAAQIFGTVPKLTQVKKEAAKRGV